MDKIIIVCNKCPFPDIDGGTAATRSLIQGLLNIGYEVQALIFNTHKHPAKNENVFEEWKTAAFSFKSIDAETRIMPLCILKNLIFEKESIHISRVMKDVITRNIQAELDASDAQVVVFDGLFALAQVPFLQKNGKTFVYRAHNVEYLVWDRISKGSQFPKSTYVALMTNRLKRFEERVTSYLDQVWAISEDTASFFKSKGVETQVIFPTFNIPTDTKMEKAMKPGRLSLFHIGAMNWMPNLEAIDFFYLEILPEFSEAFPKATFYVGGRNFPKNRYKESNQFKVVGEVDSYREFVEDMDALVVPLLSGSGIRMKIGETMALGIPVIATHAAMEGIPAIPFVHFLPFENAEEFINALHKLESDPVLYSKLSISGRALAIELFSMEKLMLQLRFTLGKLKN